MEEKKKIKREKKESKPIRKQEEEEEVDKGYVTEAAEAAWPGSRGRVDAGVGVAHSQKKVGGGEREREYGEQKRWLKEVGIIEY